MLDSESLRAIIKEAIAEVVDAKGEDSCRKCCESCSLDAKEHAEHHALLQGAFSLRSRVINAAVTSIVGGGLVWLGLAVWERLVRQAIGK